MTKTINKKLIAIAAAVVIFAVTLSLALVGCSSHKDTPHPDNDFAAEINNTEHIRLAMSEVTPYKWDNLNAVSKTLTATVLPATAENKAVDWTCDWADESNTANVSEYVTVTPETDGSTTATVTCFKAFTGNVVITATTRENGYSATCIVTFVGLPTEISLNGSLSPTGGAYKVGVQMWADTQIDDSADKRFRSLADKLIEVQGKRDYYDRYGRLIKTEWACLEFSGVRAYSRYKDSGDAKEAIRTTYTHDGNVYACVDSFSGKEYFYNGLTGNYHTTLATPTGNDKAAMLARCARYPLFKKDDTDKERDLWRN